MRDERSRREAALVARCANGEAEAWAEFVDRYGPLVRALARKMLSRRTGRAADPDTDEITAEVFHALVRRERVLLHRFDPTYRLSTYLGVICRTEVLRFLRRSNRQPRDAQDLTHVPDAREDLAPHAHASTEERTRALHELRTALGALGARDQQLLRMRFLEGTDYKEIAAAIGVNAESVGQLLTRAKKRLRARVPHLERWLDEA